MYMACLAQILARDQGLASALCPGMLGRCEEPGLSGAGPCQGPVDGRPYLAWVAAALTREISKDLRADSRRTNWYSHVNLCDSYTRLASVLVSSPKFTAKEKQHGQRRNGDKTWPWIWFSQNNEEKPYNFTKNDVRVSAGPMQLNAPPALVISSICICICTYVKRGKKIRKNKLTPR